jgi:hypothetical protein
MRRSAFRAFPKAVPGIANLPSHARSFAVARSSRMGGERVGALGADCPPTEDADSPPPDHLPFRDNDTLYADDGIVKG